MPPRRRAAGAGHRDARPLARSQAFADHEASFALTEAIVFYAFIFGLIAFFL